LESVGANYSINPLSRKLTEQELIQLIGETEVLIAGTEPITEAVLDAAPSLRLISRVGIGLDSVDLLAARERGVAVSYTPDAPAPAVAELTVGLMLSLLRGVQISNIGMHRGQWHRFMGRRLSEVTIGVVGAGRIGGRVLRNLAALGAQRLLVNDLEPIPNLICETKIEWVEKEDLYSRADLVSLHVPLTRATRNLIRAEQLALMKRDALVINTSRGGIVNESDLYTAILEGQLGGAAIDVFEQEPYSGPLSEMEECLLTCHMGSMSHDCRSQMEIEATQEAIRFLQGRSLERPVPEEEYAIQAL
jgi:D-3-phosphoglycerate dehydrogenase